jgi:anti-sigma B factor antagonist
MDAAVNGGSAAVEGHWDAPGILTLSIVGELDLSSVDSVSNAINETWGGDRQRVVFDLGGLTFMDSSGIALMLRISRGVDKVEVRNATPTVRRVIEATGLVDVLGLER